MNSQQMVSNCIGLHTQNPELKKVHFTSSAKGDSDKINMLEKGTNFRQENKS